MSSAAPPPNGPHVDVRRTNLVHACSNVFHVGGVYSILSSICCPAKYHIKEPHDKDICQTNQLCWITFWSPPIPASRSIGPDGSVKLVGTGV